MAGPARLARRQESTLVRDERDRGIDAPVETLDVRSPRDGHRGNARTPRFFLETIWLGAAPPVQEPLPVPGEQRHGVYPRDLEGLAARGAGPQEPHVVLRPFAPAGEREQRPVGRPCGTRCFG